MTSASTLSIEKILAKRSEAFAFHRYLTAMLTSLGVALEDIDTAIQSNQAERSIDEQTALVSAARRLDALLKCGVTN